MKLVMLTYLEGDEGCVERLLAQLEVSAFSRFPVEGHGPAGTGGWYAAAAPYRSEMILIFAGDTAARSILGAVRECTGVQDPKHPIRAFLLDVEEEAACGCEPPLGAERETDDHRDPEEEGRR